MDLLQNYSSGPLENEGLLKKDMRIEQIRSICESIWSRKKVGEVLKRQAEMCSRKGHATASGGKETVLYPIDTRFFRIF